MSGDGIVVVLRSQSEHLGELRSQARADLEAAQHTSSRLDALEQDLFGVVVDECEPSAPTLRPARRPSEPVASFADLRGDAQRHLARLGIDHRSVSYSDLLDSDEIARIERRFDADFSIHARLDGIDLAAIAAAGLTGALLDILLVGIPQDTKWWGGGRHINASPLTERLRDLSMDSDNALSRWAKTSYDRVSNLPDKVDGLGGLTHRVQTFGHDPLLGLVFGVRDIMRGVMTAVPKGGGVQVLDTADPIHNPLLAMVLHIGHLLSDVGTRSGLPLPGWTALVSLGGPKLGPAAKGGLLTPTDQENLGEIARRMYINGYDSWHLVTMATSTMAVEIVLRSYWGIRSRLDSEWNALIESEADRNGTTGLSDHPRFASMSLGAHGVAAAGNLAKLAMAGGNPLTLNYVQWLKFIKSFYRWADGRQTAPAIRIDRTMRANARALQAGWAHLDFGDPHFISLADAAT